MFRCVVTINFPNNDEMTVNLTYDNLQDMFLQVLYQYPNHKSLVVVFTNPFLVKRT